MQRGRLHLAQPARESATQGPVWQALWRGGARPVLPPVVMVLLVPPPMPAVAAMTATGPLCPRCPSGAACRPPVSRQLPLEAARGGSATLARLASLARAVFAAASPPRLPSVAAAHPRPPPPPNLYLRAVVITLLNLRSRRGPGPPAQISLGPLEGGRPSFVRVEPADVRPEDVVLVIMVGGAGTLDKTGGAQRVVARDKGDVQEANLSAIARGHCGWTGRHAAIAGTRPGATAPAAARPRMRLVRVEIFVHRCATADRG
mmetsp:Transcript_49386/g.160053  ORF Transcript_49386/g.160053 Transcript_49386/m.160053 type:complete len:260 (+) Transcript_49386:806-1585(+)